MNNKIYIGNRAIGENESAFIIAEMSGNHTHDFQKAKEIICAAKEAGADAIKMQTYLPDTITMNSNRQEFTIRKGSLWENRTLYDLYQEAYTPWEWQAALKEYAESKGLICFSTPFDFSSIDFLESINVLAYKISSYEINDIPLIRRTAEKKKPIIISTGVAYLEDIDLAIKTILETGNQDIILLKCSSIYPTPYEEVNLLNMCELQKKYNCIIGISDHSLGESIPVGAVALGAKVIEKHLTLDRKSGGVDDGFSMEPDEFKRMVQGIRNIEEALGSKEYLISDIQEQERKMSRSLFVIRDIKTGEIFTDENVKSIRPNLGLHTKYYDKVIGASAKYDISAGTPLALDMIEGI